MINRAVAVILKPSVEGVNYETVTGTVDSLTEIGVILYQDDGNTVFLPMHRILEIRTI